MRQGDDDYQNRRHQQEDERPQDDHGDSPMAPRLLELLRVRYRLLRTLRVRFRGASRVLSRGGARPPRPGFLADAGSPVVPCSFTSRPCVLMFGKRSSRRRGGSEPIGATRSLRDAQTRCIRVEPHSAGGSRRVAKPRNGINILFAFHSDGIYTRRRAFERPPERIYVAREHARKRTRVKRTSRRSARS